MLKKQLLKLMKRVYNSISFRLSQSFRSYGENYFIHRKVIYLVKNESAINILEGVYIGANTVISVRDDNSLEAFKKSFLSIGEHTYIGENNNIRASGGIVKIGSNCLISQNVTIVVTNHNIRKGKLINIQGWSESNNFITIHDDVWIGANSVVLPGITIGAGAVVAAGSIVTKDVEENAIVAGNPARLIRFRD